MQDDIQERPDFDHYFMSIAQAVSSRATCIHHQVGAVIVSGHRIISSGYNGSPPGQPHCIDVGCCKPIPGSDWEKCRAVHAESNAIIQAASLGIPLKGATIYCTHSPCILCAKSIVMAGIREVVYLQPYVPGYYVSQEVLESAGITLRKL